MAKLYSDVSTPNCTESLLCNAQYKGWIWTKSSICLLQQTHQAEQKTIGPYMWQFEWWVAGSDIQSNIMHHRLLRCWEVRESELQVKRKKKTIMETLKNKQPGAMAM